MIRNIPYIRQIFRVKFECRQEANTFFVRLETSSKASLPREAEGAELLILAMYMI